MARLWPSSLRGQTLLAVALALLVTQAITVALLIRADDNRRQAEVLNRAAISLLLGDERASREARRSGDRSIAATRRAGPRTVRPRGGGLARSLRLESADTFEPIEGDRMQPELATQLGQILERQDMRPARLVVLERAAGEDPYLQAAAARGARFARRPGWSDARVLVAAMRADDAGPWRIARIASQPREPARIGGVIVQTLLLFLVLMAVLFLLLRRITRPLSILTRRTALFAETQQASEPLEPEGPDDVRRLIAAHNAMEARIAAMLDEKDVMLGAIGHDLKTPLAALRVRVESVEDAGRREKMVAGIEDITRSLDDILALARIGRTPDQPEEARLDSLAASVVEEFEDMGKPVTIGQMQRITRSIHVTWLTRALRNLVSNAVRYGDSAQVGVTCEDGAVILRVDDTGPGIPDDRMADMLEPFRRGEESRNRATGGAGLGLTIARAVAQQHGGVLVLANRASGGLRAELRLPDTGARPVA